MDRRVPNQPSVILSVSVVMVGVTDMARSVAFYRDVLGLKLTSKVNSFSFFDAGGTTLALSTAHAQASENITGATEIVFGVESVQKTYESLKAQGVRFRSEPRDVNGQEWSAAFADPDGHVLSIFGPP